MHYAKAWVNQTRNGNGKFNGGLGGGFCWGPVTYLVCDNILVFVEIPVIADMRT